MRSSDRSCSSGWMGRSAASAGLVAGQLGVRSGRPAAAAATPHRPGAEAPIEHVPGIGDIWRAARRQRQAAQARCIRLRRECRLAAGAPAATRSCQSSARGPLHIFTVNSQAGSGLRYRAAAFAVGDGRTLVVAVPLREVDQTLDRLLEVEGLVGGGVILALLVLGWVVVATRAPAAGADRPGRARDCAR